MTGNTHPILLISFGLSGTERYIKAHLHIHLILSLLSVTEKSTRVHLPTIETSSLTLRMVRSGLELHHTIRTSCSIMTAT